MEQRQSVTVFITVDSSPLKVNQSHYRAKVPRRFQEVKVPRISDNGPDWW